MNTNIIELRYLVYFYTRIRQALSSVISKNECVTLYLLHYCSNAYRIVLACNVRAGHAYPPWAPDVTPFFFVGVQIAGVLVLCYILLSLSSVFICNLIYSVRYNVYIDDLCFLYRVPEFWCIWIVNYRRFGILVCKTITLIFAKTQISLTHAVLEIYDCHHFHVLLFTRFVKCS